MRILYNNGSLGRQGKSTLAYTHYNYSKNKNYKFYTNDLLQCSVHNIQNLIPQERLVLIEDGDDISFQADDNIIFDFGGKPDERLIPVIQNVHAVVVPIAYRSKSELEITAKNINAMSEYNNNIVIVITNTQKEDAEEINAVLNQYFSSYKTFTVKASKYIVRLANYGKTVFDIANESNAERRRLESLGIIQQFSELYDYLDNIS